VFLLVLVVIVVDVYNSCADDTPFAWSLLLNVMIVIVLTGLVELFGLPLIEFGIREHIDSSTRTGRLISALLATMMFMGRTKGTIAFLGALLAGFYTTDVITPTRLQD